MLDGVIATGTLPSATGEATGRITLTATGNRVRATLTDFHSSATGQLDLQLSPNPVTAKCAADSWSFVMNAVEGEQDAWSLPIGVAGGPFEVDPTYLHTAVLRVDADAGKPNDDGCVYPVLAAATLNWSIPPTHAELTVSDHGRRAHAEGAVTTTGGHPSTYTVAPGDTVEAILARFALTREQFGYLNPYDGAVETPDLRYGTVYNLSPADRGAAPSWRQ